MKTFLSLICVAFLLNSCIKNNEDPSWIEVQEWQLTANANGAQSAGVLTHDISNAWVYLDSKLVGVFEVPFKIPLLNSGTHTLTIYPAVLNNGISATKKIYPFMKSYEVEVNLIQNETIIIQPETMYKDQTQFWIENFEDATDDIEDAPTSPVSLQRVNDPLVLDAFINEAYFGRVSLDETNNIWVGSTTINEGSLIMDLPAGQEVYLEIDYHNTNSLVTGVIAVSNSGEVTDNINVQLNPQEDSEVRWKKIYIDLRDIVSGSPNTSFFEFSFQAILDDGSTAGEINIDNIKAVYF